MKAEELAPNTVVVPGVVSLAASSPANELSNSTTQ